MTFSRDLTFRVIVMLSHSRLIRIFGEFTSSESYHFQTDLKLTWILGFRLDAIYHTAIVVYGKEYYYGGGISGSGVTELEQPGTTQLGMTFIKLIWHFFSDIFIDLNVLEFYEQLRSTNEKNKIGKNWNWPRDIRMLDCRNGKFTI